MNDRNIDACQDLTRHEAMHVQDVLFRADKHVLERHEAAARTQDLHLGFERYQHRRRVGGRYGVAAVPAEDGVLLVDAVVCVALNAAGAIAVPRTAIVRTAGVLQQIAAQRPQVADLRGRDTRRSFHQSWHCRLQIGIALDVPERRQCADPDHSCAHNHWLFEIGDRLQIDDVVRRAPLVLELVEQVAAAGEKGAVGAVLRSQSERFVERARLQ